MSVHTCIVLTEILICNILRITYTGRCKSDIFWVNSEFLATFHILECIFVYDGDNFVDQSAD